MKQDAVKSAIQQYISTNRVDATSRDLTRLYATSATAGACADLRAESVSQVPMRLKSKRTGEIAPDDHPLNAVFSGRYSFQDIMRRSELSMYFWGRNLLQKNRNAFLLPRGLTWVNPNIYSLDTLMRGGLQGFRVYAASRYKIEPLSYIGIKDAVYMHEVDFDDDYEGVSPVERAFLEASSEVELAQTVLAVFRNMAIPAAIAQPAADANTKPTKEDRDNLISMLRRAVQGAVNAGRTVVSPARWEWIQLQGALKDQATDVIAANARKSVCIASRVPLELIEPSAANYATFEGARRAWGSSWLVPRVQWYAGVFTEQLAREYGDEWIVEPDFDDVPFLKEDAAARVQVVTAKLAGTMITIGQARKELGDKETTDPVLDNLYLVQGIPVPKEVLPTLWQYHFAPAAAPTANGGFGAFSGGLGQSSAISGNNALALPAVAQTPDLQLLPRPTETTVAALPEVAPAVSKEAALELKNWHLKAARKGRTCDFVVTALADETADYVRTALAGDDAIDAIFERARTVEIDALKKKASDDFATPEQYLAYWSNYDALVAELGNDWLEGYMQEVMAKLLTTNGSFVVERAASILEQMRSRLVSEWVGTEQEPGSLARLMLAGMAAGQTALERDRSIDPAKPAKAVTLDVDWKLMSTQARDFIRNYAFSLIKQINSTTVDQLRRAVSAWIESGEPLDNLKQAISQIFGDQQRAALIAQTETTRAYNEGANQRWREAGVTKAKWQTVRDKHVCPICASLHNKEGSVSEGWQSAKGLIKPPAHPGCRCFARPVLDDTEPMDFEAQAADVMARLEERARETSTSPVNKPQRWDDANEVRRLIAPEPKLEARANEWVNQLNEDQRVAIDSWSGLGHRSINRVLQGEDIPDREYWEGQLRQLNEAVESAPRTNRVTWRGISDRSGSLFEDRVERWQRRVGTEIRWNAFSSASIDPEVAASFGGDVQTGIVFEIQSNRGRYINPASRYANDMDQDEFEVLFTPNSRFRVIEARRVKIETQFGERERTLIILEDITDEQ